MLDLVVGIHCVKPRMGVVARLAEIDILRYDVRKAGKGKIDRDSLLETQRA
jgi:hypothetical protein